MSREDQQPPPPSRVNVPLQQAIEAIVTDRPIAYHAALARALRSVTAGVLLSQLLFWMPRSRDPEGWFWKTRDDIYAETALTRREQETARKVLIEAEVLEERLAGVPARIHFRINMTRLTELLVTHSQPGPARAQPAEGASQLGGKRPTGWAESAQLDGTEPATLLGGKRPTNTKTTSETTPEKQQQGAAVDHVIDAVQQAGERVVVSSQLSQGTARRAAGETRASEERTRLAGDGSSPIGNGTRALTDVFGLASLTNELVSRGVSFQAAQHWIQQRTPEYVGELLAYHDWCKEHRPDFIHDHGAWLTSSLKTPIEFPERYVRSKETDALRTTKRRHQDEQLRMALLNEARQHATSPEERLPIAQTGWADGFEIAHRRRPTEQEIAERRTRLLEGMREEAERFFAEHPELYELAMKSLTTDQAAAAVVGRLGQVEYRR